MSERNRTAWQAKWADSDVTIDGDPNATRAVRFNIYQLLIAANGSDPRVNIGANSLWGERYRGHTFWDTEVFMFPFFTHRPPGQHDPGTAGTIRPRGRRTAARSS